MASPSASDAFNVSVALLPSLRLSVPAVTTGASLTGLTVIETVTGWLSDVPSFAMYWNESALDSEPLCV